LASFILLSEEPAYPQAHKPRIGDLGGLGNHPRQDLGPLPILADERDDLFLAKSAYPVVDLALLVRRQLLDPVVVSPQGRGHINHRPILFSFLLVWSSICSTRSKPF